MGDSMKEYLRKVNYYETDQMGIVHHSNYIRYFEEARVSYMEQMGYPYDRLEAEGVASPVIGISCRYLHGVKFGDTIRICVKMTKMSRVKCSFGYEIYDAATGEIRAKGTSDHGFVGKDGKPSVVDRTVPEFYAAFINEIEE